MENINDKALAICMVLAVVFGGAGMLIGAAIVEDDKPCRGLYAEGGKGSGAQGGLAISGPITIVPLNNY